MLEFNTMKIVTFLAALLLFFCSTNMHIAASNIEENTPLSSTTLDSDLSESDETNSTGTAETVTYKIYEEKFERNSHNNNRRYANNNYPPLQRTDSTLTQSPEGKYNMDTDKIEKE